MKKPVFISIIITCKDAHRWLEKCLKSIQKQTFKDYEIVFVDDGSTDTSVAYVKKNFPRIKIIKNKKNLGFAKANNVGAAAAKGEYLLILNADTHMDKNTLEKLAKQLRLHRDYHYGQLDIKKYDKSNIHSEACTFDIDYFGYPIWSGLEKDPFYADAAAMVITRELFKKLKGFDEEFYIYLEDLDLAWRARLLGEGIHFLKGTYVYHFAGGTSVNTQLKEKGFYETSMRRRYDAQKNNIRTLIKNYSFINALWSVPISTLLASMEGFLYLLRRNPKGFIALHMAIWWNVTHIPSTLKERRRVQGSRRVSDVSILKKAIPTISKFHSLLLHGIPSMRS